VVTNAEIADLYAEIRGLRNDFAMLSQAIAVRDADEAHCRAMCRANQADLHGDGNGKLGIVARIRRMEGIQAAVVWAGGAFASVVTLIGAVVGIIATIRQMGGG
jgi:hypothetical protein